MIKINLLPEDLRSQRVIIPKVPLATCGAILAIILLFCYINVNRTIAQKERRVKDLDGRWQKRTALEEGTDEYRRELWSLRERTRIIDSLMANRIIWSKKLNELSDMVTNGIWLYNLRFEKNVLVIEGNVYSKNKDEEAIVGHFMNRIKGHSSFFGDFSDIELRIIKRKEGDFEYISFIVFCALK